MEGKQLTAEGKELLERFLSKVGVSDETSRRCSDRAERYLLTETFKGKYWVEKEKTTAKTAVRGYLQK